MPNSTNLTPASNGFSCILLAAGRGTRMATPLPKVVHPVAGSPMIKRVIDAARGAGAEEIRVVVGFGEQLVRQIVEPMGVHCFKQANQWGTADAVRAAEPESLRGTVVIMNGDHPLITAQDITNIMKQFRETRSSLAVVSVELEEPADMGRIVRQKGELRAIVEARDASADTLKIKEVNSGIYVVKASLLNTYLPRISNQNSKNEFYLTDIISLSLEGRESVGVIQAPAHVGWGVNSQRELSEANRRVYLRKAHELMDKGVMILDDSSVYIEESVDVGPASMIYPGVHLQGKTKIGQMCVIESHTWIRESTVRDSVIIRAGSYIENSTIKSRATVGPYARLRPDTTIGTEAHIGNFVELKKVNFGDRAKAGHLTYLGDAQVGEDTNIGCGTITCNYAVDKKKYKTVIGKNVFVGSDTQFIAPISIGDGAVIGSGSTITKDVPPNALAVARGKQVVKENYMSGAPKSEPQSKDPSKVK